MKIKGLQKLTLLDYKGYLAATIFTGGCNFTCPFCHNRDLVLYPNAVPTIPETEVLHYLKERQNRLEAVCITGGEPTLQKDLGNFLEKIKSLGYKIKLDTNGSSPKQLELLLSNQLIDYIAMDIKNSTEKYGTTTGLEHIKTENVERSISIIMNSACDYEFRTTVVKELHTKEDIKSICQWIQGAKAYFLQAYRDSEQVINPVYSSYSRSELEEFASMARQYVKQCDIIGT